MHAKITRSEESVSFDNISIETVVGVFTKERASQLEGSIAWLSNYKGPEEGIEHVIGSSASEEDRDEKFTQLLLELGEINARREYIISLFCRERGLAESQQTILRLESLIEEDLDELRRELELAKGKFKLLSNV